MKFFDAYLPKSYTFSWQTAKEFLYLMAQPAVVAFLAVMVWSVVEHYDIGIHPADNETVITGPMSVITIFHSLVAAGLLGKFIMDDQDIRKAILTKNKALFDEKRILRTGGWIKLLFALLNLSTVSYIVSLEYNDWWTGFRAVWQVTFVFSAFWVMLVEADDPVTSLWYKNKIPEGWSAIGEVDKV